MAIVKIIETNAGKLGIWKLSESSETLTGLYPFSKSEKSEFNLIKSEKRKKEFLAVRILLVKMLHSKTRILYNSNGKPYLKSSILNISISHSPELVTILLSEKNAGIDVENINRKTEIIPVDNASAFDLVGGGHRRGQEANDAPHTAPGRGELRRRVRHRGRRAALAGFAASRALGAASRTF